MEFACVHICICIHILHIYLYIYIHMCIRMCVYIYIEVYMHVKLCVWESGPKPMLEIVSVCSLGLKNPQNCCLDCLGLLGRSGRAWYLMTAMQFLFAE